MCGISLLKADAGSEPVIGVRDLTGQTRAAAVARMGQQVEIGSQVAVLHKRRQMVENVYHWRRGQLQPLAVGHIADTVKYIAVAAPVRGVALPEHQTDVKTVGLDGQQPLEPQTGVAVAARLLARTQQVGRVELVFFVAHAKCHGETEVFSRIGGQVDINVKIALPFGLGQYRYRYPDQQRPQRRAQILHDAGHQNRT